MWFERQQTLADRRRLRIAPQVPQRRKIRLVARRERRIELDERLAYRHRSFVIAFIRWINTKNASKKKACGSNGDSVL